MNGGSKGLCLALSNGYPRQRQKGGVNLMSVGELLKEGQYLEAMEKALYSKLLDKIDADQWEDCRQVVKLLSELSII